MKKKVLVITGPTATGKTDLSLLLAEKFNGEIINADSMQFYRQLDIGTNKTSKAEREKIPHHLIDFLEFSQNYSAGEFTRDSRTLIEKITAENKIPIMVGGSNFFIQTAIGDRKLDGVGADYQRKSVEDNQQLIDEYQKLGQDLDKIPDPKNSRRLERAIEKINDNPDVNFGEKASIDNRLFDVLIIALTTDRDILYQRIDQRVDQMVSAGLEDEARMLYDADGQSLQSGKAIGYRQWFDFFAGQISKEQAINQIKTDTHRLAKKQITYIKNQFIDANWFDVVENQNQIKIIEDLISKWLNV